MDSVPSSTSSKAAAFRARLFSTVILWIIMGTAMWYGHQTVVLGIATLLGIGGATEFASMMRSSDAAHRKGHAILVVGAAIAWWIGVWGRHSHHIPMLLDGIVLFATLQIAFLSCYRTDLVNATPEKGEITLRRILMSIFGVFYTVILFGYIPRIILMEHPHSMLLLLFIIAVTKFSDMGAYAIGTLVGSRNYMCPLISPKKTWEGFIGAFAGGFVASSSLLAIAGDKLTPITWRESLVLVPILVLLTVTGDLAESILKRCIHIKDAGQKLPGIGGILDLTDSLLYTTPVFVAYLHWHGLGRH